MDNADLSLVDTPDGLQITWRGRDLYDSRPASTAAAKAHTLPIQNQTLYLVASPGAWHGIHELLSRLPPDSAILAVEAEPVLLELSRRLLHIPAGERRLLFCAADPASIRNTLPHPETYRRVREVSFCRSALEFRARYRAIRDSLDTEIRIGWQNRLTLSDMGRLWNSNLIRNLTSLPEGIPFPRTTRPAVACGAGPSLARAIPLLAAHRARLDVIAVDTALPSLEAAGIEPDYVVAVEGQVVNLYDFLPVSRRSYTLIADLASAPAVVELHTAGPVCWIGSRYADITLLDRLAKASLPVREVPPLGSVGVTAAMVGLAMTSGPVLFTGLDFANAREAGADDMTASHAPGSPAELRRLLRASRLAPGARSGAGRGELLRTGVSGLPVTTTLSMIGYAEQLAFIVASERNREILSIEPFGLDTGAHAVSVDEAAAAILRAEGAASRTIEGNGDGESARQAVAAFVERELSLLSRLEAQLAAVGDGGAETAGGARETRGTDGAGTGSEQAEAPPQSLEDAFRACDYVAIAFPDYAGTLRRDAGFLARVRVSAGYYRERWENTLRLLRS